MKLIINSDEYKISQASSTLFLNDTERTLFVAAIDVPGVSVGDFKKYFNNISTLKVETDTGIEELIGYSINTARKDYSDIENSKIILEFIK